MAENAANVRLFRRAALYSRLRKMNVPHGIALPASRLRWSLRLSLLVLILLLVLGAIYGH